MYIFYIHWQRREQKLNLINIDAQQRLSFFNIWKNIHFLYFFYILILVNYIIIAIWEAPVDTIGDLWTDVSNTIFWNRIEIENSWILEGNSGNRSMFELKVFLWSIICNVSLRIGLKTHKFNLTTLCKHLLKGVRFDYWKLYLPLLCIHVLNYMTTYTKNGLVTSPCDLECMQN